MMAMLSGWRITRVGILFVIGVIVLGGLTYGGITLVKQRGEQVRRDQAIAIAEKNLTSQSATTPSTTATPPTESSESSPAANHVGTAATDATTSGNAASTDTTTAQLPQTGFDGAGRLVVVTVLSLSVAFYVASRRAVRES